MLRPLTPDGFRRFLRWLSKDDESAVREYQTIRRRLVRYFIQKGCADPDELFDQTVDIVVGKIEACEEFSSPVAYCYGVAKNVWRQNMRGSKSVAISGELPSPERENSEVSAQELECLEGCVKLLSLRDRELVMEYHKSQGHEKIEARKRLANECGGLNALRVKAFRIRRELRSCVGDCVERSAKRKLK